MALNNAEKALLAEIIIRRVADIFEDFEAMSGDTGKELVAKMMADRELGEHTTVRELQVQAARWMSNLPGSFWDTRLGNVPN